MNRSLLALLGPRQEMVLTITTDNGREFAGHRESARGLRADFSFAHPYAAWERGCVENTNGPIRQHAPKRASLDTVTAADVEFIVHRLDHRPRKCSGRRTPHEVFFAEAKP
jgi:IS30 family transposase